MCKILSNAVINKALLSYKNIVLNVWFVFAVIKPENVNLQQFILKPENVKAFIPRIVNIQKLNLCLIQD